MFHRNILFACIVAYCLNASGGYSVVASLTQSQVLNSTFKVDCSQYADDVEILSALPFRTYIGTMVYNRTYALMYNNNNNVHTLYINKEKYVPPTVFCLTNLQTLMIDGTPFDYGNAEHSAGVVPDALGNLKNLINLNIKDVQINKMTDQLLNLSSLTSLSLVNCNLFSLPNLAQLNRLLLLDASCNPLKSLAGLQGVRTLNLSHCQFSSIPAMTNPLSLYNLYMNSNRLSHVNSLYLYRTLQWVELQRNDIHQILPSVAQLTQLRMFNLSDNELWSLPKEILDLNQLQTLDVAKNSFSAFEVEIIKDNFKARRPTVKLTI